MAAPERVTSPGAIAGRAIAGTVGLAIVFGLPFRTWGLAVAAPIGMAVVARVQRARGHRATRVTTWIGACAGTALGVAAFVTYGVTKLPAGKLTAIADSVRAVRDTMPPPRLPEAVERMMGGRERFEQSQRLGRAWGGSKPLFLWGMLLGAFLVCAVAGLVLGSVMWAGVMLAARGLSGAWLFGQPPPEAEG